MAIGERQLVDQVQESELRRQPNQSAREVLLQLSLLAGEFRSQIRH